VVAAPVALALVLAPAANAAVFAVMPQARASRRCG
jgi:hypothetical protein